MLNTTQNALLEAIKTSLFDYAPKYPDDTDWNEVVKEAKAQTVMGLISPVIPIEDQSTNVGIANYIRLLHEQDQLIKLLDENGIPCVILKGYAAAQYYPKPHLRAMGDVDFLVPFDKFHETAKLLESNGYVYTQGKEDTNNKYKKPRHLGYCKNGIEFELHHHFSTPGVDIDDILEKAIQKKRIS